MIQVNRKSPREPEITRDSEFITLIEEILKRGEFEFHPTYFRKVTEGLRELYHNKCAYCESHAEQAAFYLTMDHYRPKGKLKGELSHPGYYWLGYEWTNLLPACPKCNSHKSSQFPVTGLRITTPPVRYGKLDREACKASSNIHIKEKPLLLHPEIDPPEKHLTFTTGGKVKALTERGKATVKTCKLNRNPLVTARKTQVDMFYKEIKKILLDFIKQEIDKKTFWYSLDNVFSKIKSSQAPKLPYSRFGWYLYHDFDTFFILPLESELENNLKILVTAVKKAFQRFSETGTCLK